MPNFRLYAALTGLGIVAVLAALVFFYRGNAISAGAEKDRIAVELKTAVAVNENNKETIKRLTEFSAIQDSILSDVKIKVDGIRLATDLSTERLATLIRGSDEKLKGCLDLALPDDFGKLFDPKNSGKNGTRGVNPAR